MTFDDIAPDYAEFRTGYSSTLYDALGEFGFKGAIKILDVGCGPAIASEPLAARGLAITGVDPSETMLEHAMSRIPSGTFIKGKAEYLPFKDKTFAGAISAQAMHWFDQDKALSEMIRVVVPNGRIAVWWKNLTSGEPMRTVEAEAAQTVGVEPLKDPMSGPFRAFYAAPLKERWVRVLPHMIMSDARRWVGYERSRRRLRESYGDKAEAYYGEVERLIRERAGERPFQVRYTQFLYVGRVGE
ncbi:MAG: class I SAM-dependent methyltransferase [Candidatus Eremiobacteraeota bacterium]|nr:class I SAM-dependent methyltransferase [Candidatus Eremiobacteraeota bacterium]MBV8354638.1 class I SAM-dependent methyltransferase [Candidatus Eremiobacteraeota bacterium]